MTPLDLHQASVDELSHVMGKQRLVDAKQRNQLALADRHLATPQHIEDAHTHGFGQRLGRSRDALRVQAGIKSRRGSTALGSGGTSGESGKNGGGQINSRCYELARRLADAGTAPVVVVGGGQSGLAAARALRQLDQPALVLEAGDRPAGSWPRYYDSLRLFSPAGFSAMPGMPFGGDPDRYPARDEVAVGDLRSGVAGADDDNPPPGVAVRMTVAGDVGELAGEGLELPASGIVAAVAADRAHGRASADLDVERGGVVLDRDDGDPPSAAVHPPANRRTRRSLLAAGNRLRHPARRMA